MGRRTALSSIAALLLGGTLATPAAAGGGDTVSVADPAGGARWTARVTADGDATCVSVRRGDDAKERWCEELAGGTVFDYNVLRETAEDPRAARTMIAVTFAPSVVRARLQAPGRTFAYRRRAGEPRVLLVVLAGLVDRPPLRAVVEQDDELRVVRTAPVPELDVDDPAGAGTWRADVAPPDGGRVCVSWVRVPDRFGAQPHRLQGAPQCGRANAAMPVATVETVDGRVVVVGLAGEDVRGLTLTVAGAPRPLPIDADSRAFLAVLPAGTDAAQLGLTARLAGGRDLPRALDPAVRRR